MLWTLWNTKARTPHWITRWVGVRSEPPKPQPLWISLSWAFVGAFCGLSVLQAVFGHASYFTSRGTPQLVASYGASAVLIYGLPQAPLAQPRAVVGGHFISALVGLIISAIFHDARVPGDDMMIAPNLSWLAASLATSIAVVAMMATKTTHPPAGATALLPIVEPSVYRLGWYLLPVVLLSSVLMVVVGLVTNNVQGRYPAFWWEPRSAPAPKEPVKESPSPVAQPVVALDGKNGSPV